MLGLKLFVDTPVPLAGRLVDRALQDGLGIEILMAIGGGARYRAASADRIRFETRFDHVPHKVFHLDHRKTQGCDIRDKATQISLLEELTDMRHLGISRAVMHYHHELPETLRRPDALLGNLTLIDAIAQFHGVTIHIENTLFGDDPAGVAFYRMLFDIALEHDLGNLGFCFDLGHAKVFSHDSLVAWWAFLDWLAAHRVPLHFHLHNNGGTDDEHLSFRLADPQGLNDGDAFTGGPGYVEVVMAMLRRWPGMKLLEVPAAEALPNLDWLQEQIAWREAR